MHDFVNIRIIQYHTSTWRYSENSKSYNKNSLYILQILKYAIKLERGNAADMSKMSQLFPITDSNKFISLLFISVIKFQYPKI